MSLGPRGADVMRKKLELNEAEAKSGKPTATPIMNMVELDHVNFYIRAAIRKHELEQVSINAGRPSCHLTEPDIYLPDIDLASVGSRPSRSNDYGREHREHGNKRVLQVTNAGAANSGKFSNQIIRMSAMASLK